MRFLLFSLLSIGRVLSSSHKKKLEENKAFLAQFEDMKKCSAAFAVTIAVAANDYTPGAENRDKFATLLDSWFDKNSDDVSAAYNGIAPSVFFMKSRKPAFPSESMDCFPMKSHIGEFYSMDLVYAQLLFSSIRRAVLKADNPAGTSQGFKNVVPIVDAIIRKFTQEQFNVLNAMWHLASEKTLPIKEVCTSGVSHKKRKGGERREEGILTTFGDLTTFDISKDGFNNQDFLVPVYSLLRQLDLCKNGQEIEKRLNLVDSNKDVTQSELKRLLPTEHETVLSSEPHSDTGDETSRRTTDAITLSSSISPPDARTLSSSEPIVDRGIAQQTFITSSIAHENKLFFDNFHAAAQQLSLLGIEAVGLATQIQAIRGHLMMLELIDQHIDTLNQDHDKYTKLLVQAHRQLREITNSNPE